MLQRLEHEEDFIKGQQSEVEDLPRPHESSLTAALPPTPRGSHRPIEGVAPDPERYSERFQICTPEIQARFFKFVARVFAVYSSKLQIEKLKESKK